MTITVDESPSRLAPLPTSMRPPHPPRRRAHSHRRNLARRLAITAVVITGAVLARIVGIPMILGVTIGAVIGIVVRRALLPRSEVRITAWRLIIITALLATLSASTFSYTGALTDPGSDPVTDRTANWMRDHHMNSIVDTIEQRLDSRTVATNGIVDRASLPNTPGAAMQTTTVTRTLTTAPVVLPAPRPATSAPASVAPTTAPIVDRTPPTAGPLLDTTLAGEGQWTANSRAVDGHPVTFTTFVRPDPTNTSVLASVVLLDPTATTLVYVPGTAQPGGTGWAWGSQIPNDQRPKLVAAFNSGWKQRDRAGGAFTEGRTAADLIDGDAALVIYADGHNDIGAWGTDVTMTPDVVSVRQNLHLIVRDSTPVDGLTVGGSGDWGSTKYQTQYTRRSGLGITAEGALVYVAGSGLTTSTLAEALVQVGAVRGMELDIHRQHPTFNFFTPAPGTPDGVTGEKLLTEQYRPATRYLQPDQRDFFAVLTR